MKTRHETLDVAQFQIKTYVFCFLFILAVIIAVTQYGKRDLSDVEYQAACEKHGLDLGSGSTFQTKTKIITIYCKE